MGTNICDVIHYYDLLNNIGILLMFDFPKDLIAWTGIFYSRPRFRIKLVNF